MRTTPRTNCSPVIEEQKVSTVQFFLRVSDRFETAWVQEALCLHDAICECSGAHCGARHVGRGIRCPNGWLAVCANADLATHSMQLPQVTQCPLPSSPLLLPIPPPAPPLASSATTTPTAPPRSLRPTWRPLVCLTLSAVPTPGPPRKPPRSSFALFLFTPAPSQFGGCKHHSALRQ